MEPRKAFWQALITVGVPFLIWGVLLYSVGIGRDWWLVESIFVILPALGLFGLVYNRYLKGPSARPTRRGYFVRAIFMGCLALAYLLMAVVNQHPGWKAVPNWVLFATWLLIAADHLRNGYLSKETVAAK
jgi:hypothetical protein